MAAVGSSARVLLTGWFSFLQGEVTAGDVLALESVSSALDAGRVQWLERGRYHATVPGAAFSPVSLVRPDLDRSLACRDA